MKTYEKNKMVLEYLKNFKKVKILLDTYFSKKRVFFLSAKDPIINRHRGCHACGGGIIFRFIFPSISKIFSEP